MSKRINEPCVQASFSCGKLVIHLTKMKHDERLYNVRMQFGEVMENVSF